MSLVCLALAAAYVLLLKIPQKGEAQGDLVLYRLEQEEIFRITFGQPERITLVKGNDGWHDEADEDFPLNQAFVDTMLEKAAQLTVLRQVAEGNESSYGLDKPANIITVETNSEKKTIYLGTVNSATGASYLRLDGSDRIYTVESAFANIFSNSLTAMAARDTVPGLLPDDVTKFEILEGTGGIRLLRVADEGGQSGNTGGSRKWSVRMLKDGAEDTAARPADDGAVVSIITSLIRLRFHEMAFYKPDGEILERCGLSQPALTLHVEWGEGETYELSIGGRVDEGNVYAYVRETDAVYLLDEDLAIPFRRLGLSDFLTLDIAPVLPDELETFQILTGDEKTEYELMREDGRITGALKNGEEITLAQFNALYYQIYGMMAEKRVDDVSKELTQEPVVTLIFVRSREAGGTLTVEIVPYDNNYYAVRTDGRAELLMNRRTAQRLIDLQ